jgi:hypothetical protein
VQYENFVNFVVVNICKTCEFYCCPLQSFLCHHKIVTKGLKILNINISEIQKKVIVVLSKLQKKKFKNIDICIDLLDFYKINWNFKSPNIFN